MSFIAYISWCHSTFFMYVICCVILCTCDCISRLFCVFVFFKLFFSYNIIYFDFLKFLCFWFLILVFFYLCDCHLALLTEYVALKFAFIMCIFLHFFKFSYICIYIYFSVHFFLQYYILHQIISSLTVYAFDEIRYV